MSIGARLFWIQHCLICRMPGIFLRLSCTCAPRTMCAPCEFGFCAPLMGNHAWRSLQQGFLPLWLPYPELLDMPAARVRFTRRRDAGRRCRRPAGQHQLPGHPAQLLLIHGCPNGSTRTGRRLYRLRLCKTSYFLRRTPIPRHRRSMGGRRVGRRHEQPQPDRVEPGTLPTR